LIIHLALIEVMILIVSYDINQKEANSSKFFDDFIPFICWFYSLHMLALKNFLQFFD